MVRGTRGDRVGLAARRLNLGDRALPALLEADAELRLHQAHVGARETADEDVADLVVDRVGPVHPALLDEHALHARARRHRRDLARVVGLHAADRHERVAALRESIRDEVFELARLVAAVGDAGVAVLALGPDCRAAEIGCEPLQRMHGRGPEEQGIGGVVEQAGHRAPVRAGGWGCGVAPSSRRPYPAA